MPKPYTLVSRSAAEEWKEGEEICIFVPACYHLFNAFVYLEV